MLGDRGVGTAQAFMQDIADRIVNRVQLTTDGHHVYINAVEEAFGADTLICGAYRIVVTTVLKGCMEILDSRRRNFV